MRAGRIGRPNAADSMADRRPGGSPGPPNRDGSSAERCHSDARAQNLSDGKANDRAGKAKRDPSPTTNATVRPALETRNEANRS